ncbi:GTPase, G3E family [Enhydrobacter aerosaccus]|uniref:GTPase, G3E family n=1 Tax=Enhydrobacter aerosaccus TaxID=225324 RepID=A0A1T4R2C2_9HYPH|nr:GTP-binding protein [Enhydrobacter aerosaccus]SKA10103.1 GTPase, G3E family [Enhydrobacter aerosaccus]
MTDVGSTRARRLPVTVIGGYLGTGKTTLVNHLLRHAGGRKLAVLVNDFGALPIDRDLIVSAGGDTLEISGGCICCSYGSELMETLMALPSRRPDLDAVLLETSGVALPGMVANAVSLLPAYRIDSIIVLVDAETVLERAADPYLGDTITRQVASADLLLVNRCDLAADDQRAQVVGWLSAQMPAAPIIEAVRATVPSELVFDIEHRKAGPLAPSALGAPDASALYEAMELALPDPVDAEALARDLVLPSFGLLRAKGFVRDRNRGPVTLQIAGARHAVEPATNESPSRLVLIGQRGHLDRSAIERCVAQHTR